MLESFSADEHRRALEAYYAAVNYVDDCIGRLLDGLRSAGLLDNTIVVYTSDHGEMAGEHGLWWKRTYYEASARVPLLVVGDGIPHGQRVDVPVELVDLFPTICDWAGIPTPPSLDGESLLPLLAGRAGPRRHPRCKQIARSELLGGRAEVRFRMVRDARWKYVEFPAAPPRLFDLAHDPGEMHDLAATPPEEAPLVRLRHELRQGLTWPDLDRQQTADLDRTPPPVPVSRAALHYRLPDGRIIDADDHLYEPFLHHRPPHVVRAGARHAP